MSSFLPWLTNTPVLITLIKYKYDDSILTMWSFLLSGCFLRLRKYVVLLNIHLLSFLGCQALCEELSYII